MNVRVACPKGYEPDTDVMVAVKRHAEVSESLHGAVFLILIAHRSMEVD